MTAEGLHHKIKRRLVAPRAGLAEPGDRHGDDVGIVAGEGLMVDPEAGHHTGPEVVHHHVGGFHKPVQQLLAGAGLQVEHNALLAPVHEQMDGALVA